MGVVADLVVKISGDSSDLRKELHASQRQIRSAFGSEALSQSQKSLSFLKYLTVGIVGAGIASVKLAADMEQTTMSFETLLGSGEEAERMVKRLTDFAAKTPFQMPGVTKSTQQLLAYGFSAESVIPILTSVGDAVSGLGGTEEDMQSVIRALGQIQAKGKVSAEEMNQLAEKGINGWKYLAEAAGVSVAEIQQLAQKGALNAGASIQAILDGMGRQFQGGMEKQSQTINGLLSTIQDNVVGAARVIGTDLAEAFDFKGILEETNKFLTEFTTLAENSGVGRAIKELVPDSVKLSVLALSSAYTARLVPALYSAATAAMAANAAMLPLVGTLGVILFTLGLIYTEYKGITDLKNEPSRLLPKGYNGTGLREHLRQNKKFEDYTDSGVEERKYADSVTDEEIRRLKKRNALEKTAEKIGAEKQTILDKEAAAKKEAEKAAKKAQKAAEAAAKKQQREYGRLVEKAKDTSDRIEDEWIQMTGTKMDVLEKWKRDEIATLDETKSVNSDYQRDLTRLEETYSEKRRLILHEEAKEKQRTIQEITAGYSDIQNALRSGGLKGSQKELFDMDTGALDDVRSVTDFFARITSEYSDATDAHKQDIIEALNATGVAYKLTEQGNLDFSKTIDDATLERKKQLWDQYLSYFKQAKGIEADIEEAYVQMSLDRLKEVMNEKNTIMLNNVEAMTSMMETYEDVRRASLATTAQLWADVYATAFDGISSSVSDFFMGVSTAEDALKSFGKSLLQVVVDFYAKKVAGMLMEGIIGKSAIAAQTAASIAAGAATAAAWAPAAAAVSLATFGANSGPAMAGISATHALSQGLSIVPFAEGGYVTGPTLAMVGEGRYNESVVQDSSSAYRKIAEGISEQSQPADDMRPIIVNLSAMDAKSLDAWLEDTGGRSLEKYFKRRGREFAMLGGMA